MDKTLLSKHLGNVTKETMFTFEYGMKSLEELLALKEIDMTKLTHLPFQTVVEYTALDGSKCLRVITKKLEITGERDEVEQSANRDLLQQNAISKGTQFARAGDIQQAQAIFKAFKRGNMKGNTSLANKEANAQYSEMVQDIYNEFNVQRANISDEEEELNA